MAGFDEKLKSILDGYSAFLQRRQLSYPRHRPYLVRWVRCTGK